MNRNVGIGVAALVVVAGLAAFLLWPKAEEAPAKAGRAGRETRSVSVGKAAGGEAAEGATAATPGAAPADDEPREMDASGALIPRAGTTAEALHLPGIDTGADLEADVLCESLAKDRRNLQTSLNMIELVPEQNEKTVGAKRLHFVAERLDRSVQRKAARAKKLGLECPE